MRSSVVPTLLAAVALASCSDGEPTPRPAGPPLSADGACDFVASRGSCITYAGASEAVLAQARTACEVYGGTFGTTCPGEGRVGTCVVPTPASITGMSLYAPGWSFEDGTLMCQNGAWIGPVPPEEVASPAAVSCANPWDGTCVDTSGPMTPTLLTAVERFCTGNDDVLLAGACPTAARAGTCTTRSGALAWETRHYDAATAASQRASCLASGGSWTDG